MQKTKIINAENEELKAAPAPEFPPNQPLDQSDVALKGLHDGHEPACGARTVLPVRADAGTSVLCYLVRAVTALILAALPAGAQVLLNVDFGVGTHSPKTGFAATGQATNDFWNLYRHYEPKFVPGMPLIANGEMQGLKLADGTATKVILAVTNAPGFWGNASGDPMFDTYVIAQNGSNIIVTLRGLDAGRYHFYLYGHADPDVIGEQNSVFTIQTQSGNLIQAQRDYTLKNVEQLGGKDLGANAPAAEQEKVAKLVNYDADAAERQWGALQRAQEVTVAKVQPLRANLPTLGVRLSFSQPLQTEVNKPMTVVFAAANAKHVGWFQQALYFVAGFALLWVLVSVMNNRRQLSAARA